MLIAGHRNAVTIGAVSACGGTERASRRSGELPDGQITQKLSRSSNEYIPVAASGKSGLPARPVLSRQEGRSRVVTNAGKDAVDAAASARRLFTGRSVVSERPHAGRTTLFAYGKTVWFRHPLLVPSCRWRFRSNRIGRAIKPAATVTRRIRRRGEHDISRKAIARGMPECFR